jgi:hypothetical protein
VDLLLTPTLGDRARRRPPWLLLPQAVLALPGAPAMTVMALLNGRRLNVPRAHQLEVLVAGVVLTAATYAFALTGGPYVGPLAGAGVFGLAYRRQRARPCLPRLYRIDRLWFWAFALGLLFATLFVPFLAVVTVPVLLVAVGVAFYSWFVAPTLRKNVRDGSPPWYGG